MAKLYTRLKINETYRAANTDDLADLGGFSVALKKGQVSYSVTIYVDGKLVKTEKNVFNASPSVTHGYAMDKVKYIDEIINIWDEYYKSVKPELLKFINTI